MPFTKFALIDFDAGRKASITLAMHEAGVFCDPYSDAAEFIAANRRSGCILFADCGPQSAIAAMGELVCASVSNPLLAYAATPDIRRACDTILAGAIDYVGWPFEIAEFVNRLRLREDALSAYNARKQKAILARSRMASLSVREGEVLEGLADGLSNKAIAIRLGISHRTVEIHRGNALGKLEVDHSAKAIRLKLESEFF